MYANMHLEEEETRQCYTSPLALSHPALIGHSITKSRPAIANRSLCTHVTQRMEDKVLLKYWVAGGSSIAEVYTGGTE